MDQYIGSCLAKIDDTTALMKCCTQNKLFLALSLHLLSFSSRNYNLFANCHFNDNHIHIWPGGGEGFANCSTGGAGASSWTRECPRVHFFQNFENIPRSRYLQKYWTNDIGDRSESEEHPSVNPISKSRGKIVQSQPPIAGAVKRLIDFNQRWPDTFCI